MQKLLPAQPAYNRQRLPGWFKRELPGAGSLKTSSYLSGLGVHTVCKEAHCPNLDECFKAGELAFMLLGDTCTRSCSFCAVNKSSQPNSLDKDEPERIAQVVKELGLRYVVLTSVTRDDLEDGGSTTFADTIKAIRRLNQQARIEALIPDFCGKVESLNNVLIAKPDVLAHNLETVKRLYGELRPQADYCRSLKLLGLVRKMTKAMVIKSSLMLGLGETKQEVISAMKDLLENGCQILTLGQYLAPSSGHYPVKRFLEPAEFAEYRDIGASLGFKTVFSGPLIRSSYKAKEAFLGEQN